MTTQEAEVTFDAFDAVLRLAPAARLELEALAASDVPKPPAGVIFCEMVLRCRGRILVGASTTVH